MANGGLEGRVVLVTEANSGIGVAIARAFGEERAAVAVHYLEPASDAAPAEDSGREILHAILGRPAAEAVTAAIRAAGGRAEPIAADLSDPAAISPLFDRAEELLGPVEVLVNNAVHCELPDTISKISAGALDRTFAVNARAPVLLTAELARRMERRGARWGRVINLSTDSARCFAGQIAYGASKAALEAFTRSTAWELGALGITLNATAPGPVQTGYITPELERELLPQIPLGRLGEPADIADVVVFLASEGARWVTGQVIQVAGGHAL